MVKAIGCPLTPPYVLDGIAIGMPFLNRFSAVHEGDHVRSFSHELFAAL